MSGDNRVCSGMVIWFGAMVMSQVSFERELPDDCSKVEGGFRIFRL